LFVPIVSIIEKFYCITVFLFLFLDTQKYVVTFTTSQSYIEVPGWRKGDIAFSFRTTGEKAILLYQPPIRRQHPSFMVALTSGLFYMNRIIHIFLLMIYK